MAPRKHTPPTGSLASRSGSTRATCSPVANSPLSKRLVKTSAVPAAPRATIARVAVRPQVDVVVARVNPIASRLAAQKLPRPLKTENKHAAASTQEIPQRAERPEYRSGYPRHERVVR